MSKSIRVSNGKETFDIDSNDLNSAVKDGFLPQERIIVASPKTKESFEIDPKDYLSAMKDGFSFVDLSKKKDASPFQLFRLHRLLPLTNRYHKTTSQGLKTF